ncbi:MAG TPA: hypothetical protein VLA91_10710 [Acidimicrobiia bacterium]|nr:hypothetical protein [Acidimicrobiia bacterium]
MIGGRRRVRAADREGQEAAILAKARLAAVALRHSGLQERDVLWAVGSTVCSS